MPMFKLEPSFKDYLWGGSKLITDFHKKFNGDVLAESWELSCHPDGPSIIENGEFSGKTLREYLDQAGKGVLGRHGEKFQDFPILIKLIDAKQDLSVQVHPDDAYALKNEGQYGKTEVWYVVDCEPGAYLYFGFSKEISREEFRERIESNTLTEVLNKVPVKKGDVFFIEARTIHAICAGILIAEIQQNSNVTYRVYDYGRRDKEGHQRELHIDKALEVTNTKPPVTKDAGSHVATCDYFTVDKLSLDERTTKEAKGEVNEDSFLSILVLEGSGKIQCGGEGIEFQKGDSIFLTAGSGEYSISGACEALLTKV